MYQPNALGFEHHHRDGEVGQVLLEREIAVAGDEDLEVHLCQCQETAVLDASPAHFLDRLHLVTGQVASQPPIQALVQKQLHFKPVPAISPWQPR